MRGNKLMKNITVSITEAQADRLKSEQLRSGAPVSLQVRRALDLADQQPQPHQKAGR
jgi:hypothetical protein